MARTLIQVIKESAVLGGFVIAEGTLKTAGARIARAATSDWVDEGNYLQDSAAPSDRYIIFTDGDSAGVTQPVSEIARSATVGTTLTALFGSTTPTGTPAYILSLIPGQRIIDAVRRTTERYRKEQAVPLRSTELVTNNLLDGYGDFERWAVSTVPDAWALTNATATKLVISSSSPPRHGSAAVAITDSGSAGGYAELVVNPRLYPALVGASVSLKGYFRASTGTARVTIIATDNAGATTTTNYSYTGSSWSRIEDQSTVTTTIPATLHKLVIRITAVAASDVAEFDDLRLMGPRLTVQRLPALLAGLPLTLYAESGGGQSAVLGWVDAEDFDTPLHWGTHWDVSRDSVDGFYYIHWKVTLPYDSHVLIDGYRFPTVVTTMTDSVDPNPEFLAVASAISLTGSMIDTGALTALPYVRSQMTDLQGHVNQQLRSTLNDMMRTSVGNRVRDREIVWCEE